MAAWRPYWIFVCFWIRQHGFRSVTQVCFRISILNFICMFFVAAQLKHYHRNILGIFRDVPVGNSGISSWEWECCLSQAMVRNNGNGQNLLGICWEFWWNMQMRFTGTKCLIRHWEYFPVWILGMLCEIPTRFSQCLIRHWEWWETAGNSIAKDPSGWIQIGESRWEVARESREGFSSSGILATPWVRDSPIWIQPRGVFRFNPTPGS